MKRSLLLLPLLGACVPPPPEMLAPRVEPRIVEGVFPSLDPGASEAQTLHFVVKAYGLARSRDIGDAAEADYARIMQDTGLYSFRFGGTYNIVVYGTADEYHRKTQMPQWSGGATVGNAIYSYEGAHLRPTIAHEMLHLIFNEFMTQPRPDLRWLNEGLAVYQETQSSTPEARRSWEARMDEARRRPIPFGQMTNATPLTEQDKAVSLWYQQSASVVRHLLERGGRIGFEQFLKRLKEGDRFDQALVTAFPGLWANLDALERDWTVH